MSKQAVLPDGRTLEFPDDTDDKVIQAKVKEMLGVKTTPVKTIGIPSDAQLRSPEDQAKAKAEYNKKHPYSYEDFLAHVTSLAKSGASIAGGAAAGIASGSPVIGSAAGAIIDNALSNIIGERKDTPLEGAIDITKNTAIGEIGGRIIGGVVKSGRGVFNAIRESDIADKGIPRIVAKARDAVLDSRGILKGKELHVKFEDGHSELFPLSDKTQLEGAVQTQAANPAGFQNPQNKISSITHVTRDSVVPSQIEITLDNGNKKIFHYTPKLLKNIEEAIASGQTNVESYKILPAVDLNTVAKSNYGAGSVVGKKDLLTLKPTASQLLDKGPLKTITGGIEDLATPFKKNEALVRSTNLAKSKAEQLVSRQAGLNVRLEDTGKLPEAIKEELVAAKAKIQATSNAQAANVVAIGDSAPEVFQSLVTPSTTKQVVTGVNAATGMPITSNIPVPAVYKDITVNGPVKLDRTIKLVTELRDDIQRSAIDPDPEKGVLGALNSILKATNAQVEGGIVVHDPIDFGAAWKTKQVADAIGHGGSTETQIKDVRFRQIAKAINEDIDAAIPNWSHPATQVAEQEWKNAKLNVQRRLAVFSPDHVDGRDIESLLATNSSSNPAIDAILKDKTKLRQIKLGSSLKINEGTGVINLKGKSMDYLRGYKLQQIFNDALEVNPKDPATKIFNGVKLFQHFDNPIEQEALSSIFGNSTNKSNVRQFFKNVAEVSQKHIEPSHYLALRATSVGIQMSAALTGAIIAGSATSLPRAIGGAALIGGVIGFNALGKLLTDPTTGRIMVAMAQGQPLGISSKLAARFISRALIGHEFSIKNSDGSLTTGVMSKDGFKENP